jgi:LysM repeat protein
MPMPRERGGLAEASRLLQEGLELLAQRQLEVDGLLEEARERALQIRQEAEQRAAQITAEAEQQRIDLETQVAKLREEVAALAQELDRLKGVQAPEGGSANGEATTSVAELTPDEDSDEGSEEEDSEEEDSEVGLAPEDAEDAAEEQDSERRETAVVRESAGDGDFVVNAPVAERELILPDEEPPRWGRRPTPTAPQEIRSARAPRRKWLPPWIPFLLILVVSSTLVATNLGGQIGSAAEDPKPELTRASVQATSTPKVAATATVAPTTVIPTTAPTQTQQTTTMGVELDQVAAGAGASGLQEVALPPPGSRLGTPVALPGNAGIVAAYTAYVSYTVQQGDTLNGVASQFGVSGETIVRSSGLVDADLLVPGQVLTIPRESGWLYRAEAGETLGTIATRVGVSADELTQANTNLSGGSVHAGDLVFVPDRPATQRH